MAKQEREPPGLKSIREARQKRERSGQRVTPQHVLFVLLTGLVVTIAYHYVSAHKLDVAKDALLQKQRAVEATVGAEWKPLCDRIEKITLEAAGPYKGDFVDSEAGRWEYRSTPGIYLRARIGDAGSVDSLRRAAQASARDSFAGCLLRESNTALAKGLADAGAFADQPWNLRQAYQATRLLTDDWVREVKESDDDLRLRVFQQQYDKAVRDEIPLAVEMIKRAQFFLLVLDEKPEDAQSSPDEEALQLVPHATRVVVVNLKTGGEFLRLRRTGQAAFYMAGESANVDPAVRAAMQRNVNNCDLASQVQAAVAERSAAR